MMPGGAGKAKRSCPMCKPYKFAGNGKDRSPARDQRDPSTYDDTDMTEEEFDRLYEAGTPVEIATERPTDG